MRIFSSESPSSSSPNPPLGFASSQRFRLGTKISRKSTRWWLIRPSLLLLSCLVLLTGCGYRLGDSSLLSRCYSSISIPYVDGDQDGRFTSILVEEVISSGRWRYCNCGGELTLHVRIVRCGRENIGFQFDRNAANQKTRRIVPNEGRFFLVVEVKVIETATGCVLLGPTCMQSYVDYDFDPLSTENQLAVFSLGQYTAIDEAEDTARIPLYRQLARKVVDFLLADW